MKVEDLDQEIIDRLKACENREDAERMFADAGIVLTDEELEMVVGGGSTGSGDFFDKYKKQNQQ